jgi:amidase
MSVPMGSYPRGTEAEKGDHNGLVNVAPGIPYVIERLDEKLKANETARFSTYIFGRATKDEDGLKVGYVVEQMTRVRSGLKRYMEPKMEIEDVITR